MTFSLRLPGFVFLSHFCPSIVSVSSSFELPVRVHGSSFLVRGPGTLSTSLSPWHLPRSGYPREHLLRLPVVRGVLTAFLPCILPSWLLTSQGLVVQVPTHLHCGVRRGSLSPMVFDFGISWFCIFTFFLSCSKTLGTLNVSILTLFCFPVPRMELRNLTHASKALCSSAMI